MSKSTVLQGKPFVVRLYTFAFADGKLPRTIPARFTFVYKVVDKKCLIISHHSSKLPSAKE